MKSFRILAGAACLGVSVLLAAGCSSNGSPAPASTSAGAAATGGSSAGSAASATLSTTSTSLGTVLTGANGLTLYRFDPDTSTTSACTGGCASVWPPVLGKPVAGTGVNAADLGTITRSDGTTQATYQGHPLYTYSGDTGPGQTSGDGIQGTWHVMLASGSGGGASMPSSAPTTTSGGAGGY